ncbi:MAG: glycosyl hydrolase [Bacillota bacterium]
MNYNNFKDCSSKYRSAPFWAWNDKLEVAELTRQIEKMKEQGIGGFFMHSRGGLMDEYLGKYYMKAVKACVDKAEELNMKAWLYDEDRFPSGYAGGLLSKMDNAYRQKYLKMEQKPFSEIAKNDGILKIYCCDLCNKQIKNVKDVTGYSEKQIKNLQGTALVFRVKYSPRDENRNNQSYLDLCYKKAVDKFIETTHERYAEIVGNKFTSIIPGIFTDEPHFKVSGDYNLPWTFKFAEKFKSVKGYNILDKLPALIFEMDNYKKIRFDYWDVISKCFVDSFSKNIYNWCEDNQICLTGHFWEHTFPSPEYTGSTMPNYEYMQIPGIDMLFNTEERKNQVGNDLIVKEVSSVANQLGKDRVLSETYGASGWELNFKDQKIIADWQLALGINFFCQHLSLYSLRGYRKRDFPLSFLDHQPWWDYYKKMGDYLGRMSYILSQGVYKSNILLLHPSSSTWT